MSEREVSSDISVGDFVISYSIHLTGSGRGGVMEIIQVLPSFS